MYYGIAIVSVLIASVSQILLKNGAMKKHTNIIREYLNPWVIGGYGLMFVSLFLTMLAYRGLTFMNVPVIEAVGYILVPVLSYFAFRERFTRKKIGGIVLILCGILIYHC